MSLYGRDVIGGANQVRKTAPRVARATSSILR
jgi:hypothetical protein